MENHLRKRIQSNYYQLTNTSKLIADLILKYENERFDLNLVTLAKQSFCSNAAITKFIQSFGYTSYKVFVNDLNMIDESNTTSITASVNLVDEYYKHNKEIIKQLIQNIKKASNIYLFASGQSQLSALDFTLKCNKKEKGKYIFESSAETQSLLIHTISDNDFVIFISNSGESRELIQFLKEIRNPNMFLITNREVSSLSKQIKNTISLNNNIESKFTFKEFSKESKYSLLYFFDCLFESLYEQSLNN